MYKIIAIFGESGSGKNFIKEYALNHFSQTHNIISYTTRPMRDCEKNGVDYHFITQSEIMSYILNHQMIEVTSFKSWFYGTKKEDLSPDLINIGIFNKYSIKSLLKKSKEVQVIPIYCKVGDKVRLERALAREANPDCKEICRRYLADLKDFEEIDFPFIVLNNNNNNNLSTDLHKSLKYYIENFDTIHKEIFGQNK